MQVLASVRTALARAGLRSQADFDLWTAVIIGLASQQLANDPGGDRYIRLIDDAVAMFADHILGPGRPRRASTPAQPAHPDDRNGQT